MKNEDLYEIPFDESTKDFVKKHLAYNADQFLWYIWAAWLVYAAFAPWLIPIVRWLYEIPTTATSKLTVLAAAPILFLWLNVLIDWIADRGSLLNDRYQNKLFRYRGRMKIRTRRIKGVEERFIELLEVAPKLPQGWSMDIRIPLETDFVLPDGEFGELEYLKCSKIPYRLDGKFVAQTCFRPFKICSFKIALFFVGLATVLAALFLPPLWALLVAALYFFGIEKVLPSKEPESVPFWDTDK